MASTSIFFACTGTPVTLWLDALSRGIGQSYQWQLKNAANGNTYTDVPGATYDTLNKVQNGDTYYRCRITCNSLSAYSGA
jgi:hypothetical protein